MFYQLPPVGNPVCLSKTLKHEKVLQVFGPTYQPHYYDSGTSALAAAIMAAIRYKAVDVPEVILPAYGCPDLISAVVFAGAKPVLVDLEMDRPWMDLEQVANKLSEQTVAILAVDLFGILERMAELRSLAEKAGAVLIEDSAQAFLSGNEKDIWTGDLVVLSFGRGKPVSLLGGGAVLSRSDGFGGLLQGVERGREVTYPQQLLFYLKALLYNGMISPRLYWLPQSLPFLHLGETHYYPLKAIEGMDSQRLSLLPVNIAAYRDDEMSTQQQLIGMLDKLALEGSDITDLPGVCKIASNRRLLRYPLLVEPETRDRLYNDLHHLGLGSSRMYPSVLPEISGLQSLLMEQGEFPAASSFVKRLLTLPTHQQVSIVDIDNMYQVLSC